MFGENLIGVDYFIEFLYFSLPGELGYCFDCQTVFFVDLLLQSLHFLLDIIFVVDFDHPFLQFLLQFHLFLFVFYFKVVAVPLQGDGFFSLAEVLFFQGNEERFLLL